MPLDEANAVLWRDLSADQREKTDERKISEADRLRRQRTSMTGDGSATERSGERERREETEAERAGGRGECDGDNCLRLRDQRRSSGKRSRQNRGGTLIFLHYISLGRGPPTDSQHNWVKLPLNFG